VDDDGLHDAQDTDAQDTDAEDTEAEDVDDDGDDEADDEAEDAVGTVVAAAAAGEGAAGGVAVEDTTAEQDAPPVSDNRRRAERTAPLFAELATLEKDDPRRERLREILVEEHLPLVRHFARRFSNRGEPFDDLLQVGTLGLIAAIDRFDPDRGVEFLSFAVPTITGEIKRHFRDQGWSVRVPRRLQELHLSLNSASASWRRRTAGRRRRRSWPSTWASRARRSSRAWPWPTPTAAARWTSGSPARTTPPRWPPRSARRTPRSRAWSTASRCSRCWPPSRPASAASSSCGSSAT
jgi:RNA polymerase sigma factor (sigma-70 family)